MEKNHDNQDFWKRIVIDPAVRMEIARKNHLLFFHIYFPHYILYKTAPFHKEIFGLTHDNTIKTIVIEAFRGSGKSTIMSLSYPLWAILGCQQKKFILLVAQTQEQAHQYLANIKKELETNTILREDMGPFTEDEEWRSNAILIPKYNARIAAVSTDTSIRGLRHIQHRPDLIICDDLENLASVKTREGRDKIYSWFVGDVMSLGDENTTRVVIIGTPLHEDSLISRLKGQIKNGFMHGIIKSYPLINETGKIAWPGKYPTLDDIEKARQRLGNESAWEREYMLRIIADEDQVIKPEWIGYYDTLPNEINFTAIGVDLAISENEAADFTAIVAAQIVGSGKDIAIYILPNPVNERLDYPEQVERIKLLSKTLGGSKLAQIYIEDVAYQKALIQELKQQIFPAEGIQVFGQDKRARLASISHLIQSGKILFPRQGAEMLIEQLLHFGVEKHDDLVDALTTLVRKIIDKSQQPQSGWHEMAREYLKRMKNNPNSPGNLMKWKRLADNEGFNLI